MDHGGGNLPLIDVGVGGLPNQSKHKQMPMLCFSIFVILRVVDDEEADLFVGVDGGSRGGRSGP
jgi:hypothetical protein